MPKCPLMDLVVRFSLIYKRATLVQIISQVQETNYHLTNSKILKILIKTIVVSKEYIMIKPRLVKIKLRALTNKVQKPTINLVNLKVSIIILKNQIIDQTNSLKI